MIDVIAEPPVVFDADAVARLAGGVDDAAFAAVFVATYRRLLPGRVGRIATALAEADLDTAIDATLSLKVSSATLGAEELCRLALALEARLRRADLAGANVAAAGLPAAAERADRALGAYLAA
jgi:HPt (histidine-containing phosphotransfer) domain-containing protein